MRTTAAMLLLGALLAACGTNGASKEIPPEVERAATAAREIRANPDDHAAILEKHGFTPESFEALMYEIAEDEALSAAYEKALAR